MLLWDRVYCFFAVPLIAAAFSSKGDLLLFELVLLKSLFVFQSPLGN